MSTNCAPDNLSVILDEIIASQQQTSNPRRASQKHCIANLKVLSSWLFEGDALTKISRKGCTPRAIIKKMVGNPHLSNALLEQMADYPDAEIRAAVAEHNYLPGHVSYALSLDESITVRYMVAFNLTTPMQILEQLREDDNPYVVARAAQTMAQIAQRSKAQATVANLNWKENFKAQNTSGKNKKLERQDIATNSQGYRSVAAS